MALRIRCPICGSTWDEASDPAGKTLTCPNKHQLRIPAGRSGDSSPAVFNSLAPSPPARPVSQNGSPSSGKVFCVRCNGWVPVPHNLTEPGFVCQNKHLIAVQEQRYRMRVVAADPAPTLSPQKTPQNPTAPAPSPGAPATPKAPAQSTRSSGRRRLPVILAASATALVFAVASVVFGLTLYNRKPPVPEKRDDPPPIVPAKAEGPLFPEGETPALLVYIRSIDELEKKLKLAGNEVKLPPELRTMLEKTSDSIDPETAALLDHTRPLIAYLQSGERFELDRMVVAIPLCKGEDDVFAVLQRKKAGPRKLPDGGFVIEDISLMMKGIEGGFLQPGSLRGSVHGRFANGYVYLTGGKPDALRPERLLAPTTLFTAGEGPPLSVHLFPDQLDVATMVKMMPQIERAKEQAKQFSLNSKERPEDVARRGEDIDQIFDWVLKVIRQAKEVSLTLDVRGEQPTLEVELAYRPKEGSDMARKIASLDRWPSLSGLLPEVEPEFAACLHLQIPEFFREAMIRAGEQVADEPAKPGEAPEDCAPLEFFKSMRPTVTAGEVDLALAMWSDKTEKFVVLGALKLANGRKVEEAYREMCSKLPAKHRDRFEFDVGREGDISIHRFDFWTLLPENLRQVAEPSNGYIAFREDCVLWAFGHEGRKVLQEALKRNPKPGPVADLRLDAKALSKRLPLAAPDGQALPEFGNGTGKVRFRIEGRKDGMRVRLSLELSVARYVMGMLNFKIPEQAGKEEK